MIFRKSKYWAQGPLPHRTGLLTGLIAGGATMTTVFASQMPPGFWLGFLTGRPPFRQSAD